MRKGGKLEGWKVERLGDVIQLEYGKPLDASKRSEDGKYPVYGANGEIARSNEYYYDKPTMIVGRKGSAGEINLTEKNFWALDVTYFVTFDDKKYDLQFLYYLLSKLELTKLAKGVKPGINRNDVYSIEVTIPPLPEQQWIVSVLDEAFASIAQAKSNAERNLVNAWELFETVLETAFDNSEWEEKRLDEICEVKDGTHDTPQYEEDGIPFVTQKNIREDGLSFDNTKFIALSDHEKYYKRSNVFFGDILISMIGANRGMACLVDDKRVFSIKNVGLIKSSKNINQSFLLYFLKSPKAKKYISINSKGGAQEFIGLTELRKFPILFAPLAEQRAIVGRLEALSAETGRLEEIYQQKVESLEELKKPVLAKAFEGEI